MFRRALSGSILLSQITSTPLRLTCHTPRSFFARTFSTSQHRPVHPLFWIVAKQAGKVVSILGGRSARKWWQKLTPEMKAHYKAKLKQKRHYIIGTAGVGLCAGIFNIVSHIEEAPITKRKRYIAFTPDQMEKLVNAELEAILSANRNRILPADHAAYAPIRNTLRKLIDSNQDVDMLKKQTWTIFIVDSNEKNALCLPSGHIIVYTGMLKAVQNVDQFAVVLAHEMSHAILKHGAEKISFTELLEVVVIFVMAFIWFFMPNDGISLVTQWFYNKVVNIMLHLPYSRKLEAEADEVGLQLVAKACFDVREASALWRLMWVLDNTEDKNTIEMPEYLSTHPANEHRADVMDRLIPKATEMRKNCNCPPLAAVDPRSQVQLLVEMVRKQLVAQKEEQVNAGVVVKPGELQVKPVFKVPPVPAPAAAAATSKQ